MAPQGEPLRLFFTTNLSKEGMEYHRMALKDKIPDTFFIDIALGKAEEELGEDSESICSRAILRARTAL